MAEIVGTPSLQKVLAIGADANSVDITGLPSPATSSSATNKAYVDAAIAAGGAVTSVFSRTGVITAQSGDYTTAQVSEVTNLYYTDVRADARITAQKGLANGLATLDASGLLPSSQLPAIAITSTFVVASQVAMLALTAQTGDVAVRTDLNESYILQGTDPTVLGDWVKLLTPTDAVLSVNGQTGSVVLTTTNIAEGTNLYYTDARARASISLTTTGTSGAATYNSTTGVLNIPSYAAGTGTVTSVSVVTANGVSGSVATSTTTPAITLSLGAITPTSVASSGTVTGSNLSGSNTGDQSIFSTIAVSGQSNIVADTTSDTLTIVAGAGITLTTDAATDTLTITGTATGANAALSNLASVAINTSLLLGTSGAGALGSTTKMWSDLFLASGGVINFANSNVTITHSTGGLTYSVGTVTYSTTNISHTSGASSNIGYELIGNSLTTGNLMLLRSNTSNTSTRTLFQVTNTHVSSTGTTPFGITQSALTSTNFQKLANFGGSTIWRSNGTTPSGSLSGTAGDFLINGASNSLYWCTGTTTWLQAAPTVSPSFTGVITNTGTSSTTQADIIATFRTGSINITSPYVANGFTPALYFSSTTDNPGMPKTAIFSETTAGGSYLFLGTSASYAAGITNLVSISPDSLITSGGMQLSGNRTFVSASNDAYVYHTTALGLVMYGNGTTDDITLAGAGGANVMSVATGTTTARFYGAVNIGGTFARRGQSGVLSVMQMEGIDFDSSSLSLVVNESSNATTAPSILFGRTRGSTVGSNTVVQTGDRVGIILFGGSDGTNNVANAMIQTVVEGTPATGDVGGRLEFLTTQAGVPGPVVRMSINNSGSVTLGSTVGVGSNALYAGLTTLSGSVAQILKVVNTGTSASTAIEIRDAAATNNVWWIGTGAQATTDGRFFVYDQRQTLVRTVWDTNGSVTLGSTAGTGTGALYAGDATFTGAIAINNTVASAAAVASTHKVTVVIGGTTYYLLATT